MDVCRGGVQPWLMLSTTRVSYPVLCMCARAGYVLYSIPHARTTPHMHTLYPIPSYPTYIFCPALVPMYLAYMYPTTTYVVSWYSASCSRVLHVPACVSPVSFHFSIARVYVHPSVHPSIHITSVDTAYDTPHHSPKVRRRLLSIIITARTNHA